MDPYRFAPTDQVARVQQKYVRLFREAGATRVLDLGCGRGIFLQLLRDAGIDGVGIDLSAGAVDMCLKRGLHALPGDALEILERFHASGEMFSGVFCSHLVEHLPGDAPPLLIQRGALVLSPGGLFVIVTPNVESLQVLTQGFWLDATHVRLVPRLLVETLMADAGLQVVQSAADPETPGEWAGQWRAAPWWRRSLWRLALGRQILDRYLCAGLDAYVVGRRPVHDDQPALAPSAPGH